MNAEDQQFVSSTTSLIISLRELCSYVIPIDRYTIPSLYLLRSGKAENKIHYKCPGDGSRSGMNSQYNRLPRMQWIESSNPTQFNDRIGILFTSTTIPRIPYEQRIQLQHLILNLQIQYWHTMNVFILLLRTYIFYIFITGMCPTLKTS